VIRRRGRLRRALVRLGTGLCSLAALAGTASRRERGTRWLLPLALFLCATGLLLLFAFSVETIAPFIYAIF
jgi:hypothetical protein